MQLVYAAATQAIDFDPSDEKLYSNRSLCWMRLGQADQALTDARICRELKPNLVKAWYREGLSLRLKFDEAANAFYEGVKLEPENMELVNAFREAVEAGRQFHVISTNGVVLHGLIHIEKLLLQLPLIVDPKTRDETPVTVSVDDGICPRDILLGAYLRNEELVFKKDDSTTYITKLSSLPTSGISLLNNLCNGFL
ncbi:ankyrin repeat family protein [Tanacetum coccineum]